jgi:hypothetical protein
MINALVQGVDSVPGPDEAGSVQEDNLAVISKGPGLKLELVCQPNSTSCESMPRCLEAPPPNPYNSSNKKPVDIDIPNGPAEEGTRGLLKAHDPKITKPTSPIKRRYGSWRYIRNIDL